MLQRWCEQYLPHIKTGGSIKQSENLRDRGENETALGKVKAGDEMT